MTNIREVYKYRISALNNLKELTRAKQINDDKLYTEKENQLQETNSKIREYYIKADDEIKKLEALSR